MGNSRRFHTKTRNGCTNCKKRRVKCNLQAPQCHHCKRRGEECSFQFRTEGNNNNDDDGNKEYGDLQQQPNDGEFAQSDRGSRDKKPSELRWMEPSTWPSLDIRHSELRWQYQTLTSGTLALLKEDPRRVKLIWRGEVPLQLERSAWLDHCTMAISALHICYLQPPNPREYYTAAFKNYRSAVVAFPKAVQEMNPENCITILSFSLLILMFQLGISCVPGAAPMTNGLPVADAYNAISALRGTWSLIDQLNPHLQNSRLSALFVHRKHLRFEALDENHEIALAHLRQLNETSGFGVRREQDRQICAQAITVLRFWFSILAAQLPTTWLLLLWWPAGVSPEFLDLLKNKDPMALVIFCHWCVGMHRLPTCWYLDGWARRMLGAMLELLDTEWLPAVQWPIDEVFHPNDEALLRVEKANVNANVNILEAFR
ncbi:hypothetical protein BGW36DRAFT_364246 [Talaromyces proteolyticus]|uniref:Zn(2)-C6 fungal-type domain-containing protein n=1 Tax=Talaromyces proteolyticus TaxID=1131652 RepID=A0AAD4KGQ3_9EURO|nr:uncharacterized protein BGW36DRAFT_364246 [Talaromyces proteolyticus]KAH8690678.1 hypothetical protein BGW36DRAFT_364246 [Talaromyces proteolyticus]